MKTLFVRLMFGFLACLSWSASAAFAVDFTGFWKVNCSDAFGVQIKPHKGKLYSVSFCGPGGCAAPGTWQPDTTIEGDPHYRVINPTTLDLPWGQGDWKRYIRCTTDTNPKLDYSTMEDTPPTPDVIYFQPNQGLPDYEHKSPFTATSPNVHEDIRRALAQATVSAKECKVGDVAVPIPGMEKTPLLFSNICDRSQFDALRKLVAALAPDLGSANTTVWKTELTNPIFWSGTLIQQGPALPISLSFGLATGIQGRTLRSAIRRFFFGRRDL